MERVLVNIFNISIDNFSMEETIHYIDYLIAMKNNSYVVTPNVDHIVKLQSDDEFKTIYDKADLVLADGMPIVWASKLLGKPIKEKVSGSDLFPKLCEHASINGYSIFLLGAALGVAEKAAKKLIEMYPKLNIVGTYSPSFGFENDKEENEKIIRMIKESKPDILFVGVGAPKQEKWIFKYKNKYNVPVSLGIGASFDFIAGNIKRAPKWMQNCGLEWFYRLLKEPKRMFKRYIIDDSKFIKIFIGEFKKML
jgi:exopolysaccharide biosynthesis WecB/TagA/CpsF family protein